MDQIASKHGFCKRKRKITPLYFLEMLLLKTFESNHESLSDHVCELKYNRNISVKKQSLHNRFTSSAVAFMKDVIDHQLKAGNSFKASSVFKPFSKVFIQDGTKFGLPNQLIESYPSSGCRKATAGAQIQFTYELKKQQMCHLELHSANRSESRASVNNSWIEKDSLVLRDLGYFTFKGFREIIDKQAFFISKAKPKTSFYDLDNEKLDLKRLINHLHKHQISCCEKDLIMGFERKKQLPVRVIFCLVPDCVKEQRLRQAAKNAKERNWTVSDEYKLWAGINVFVTNLPQHLMSARNIPQTYKLRWQIELIFKTWKSHHKIHLYKAVKKERFQCYLYASLLLILLQSCIYSWMQELYSKQKIWLSIHKFSKVMRHLNELFRMAIITGKQCFKILLQALLSLGKNALFKEEKKGKIGYNQIIIFNK